MKKILVEIKNPAAGITYDVFVPVVMQVGTLTNLAATAFTKLSGGVYTIGNDAVLCEQETGRIFDPDKRIFESDIANGTRFFLL